ncbi:unnamed protein product [Plutella xylostella]|uniref:(diamondback moth) hypothetical protein n=1 Tax=Plutella xylostella TaxID=51655 RepID=A0A8S4DEX5_PLUXY|nr:unnamed protein product [Plutella xylostella]
MSRVALALLVLCAALSSPPGFCLCNPTFSSGVRRLMPLKINRNPKEIPQYPLNEHTTANLDCRTGPGQELRTARGSLTALVTNDTFLGLDQSDNLNPRSKYSPGNMKQGTWYQYGLRHAGGKKKTTTTSPLETF